jgi:outer membrane protein
LARGELNAKWLLLDFGERKATTAAAREKLMMANVGFNGTHQKIVFDVTDRFYQLGTARQKVMVLRAHWTRRNRGAGGAGAVRQRTRHET